MRLSFSLTLTVISALHARLTGLQKPSVTNQQNHNLM